MAKPRPVTPGEPPADATAASPVAAPVNRYEANIKLYPDKFDPTSGKKNGRAGAVILPVIGPDGLAANISVSIYMDQVETQHQGRPALARTYKLSVPKSVTFSFADDAAANNWKSRYLANWMAGRPALKPRADDAPRIGGAAVTEYDPA